ncbi:MAG: phosphatase PAP2 family protein [Nibricoccus sp.]
MKRWLLLFLVLSGGFSASAQTTGSSVPDNPSVFQWRAEKFDFGTHPENLFSKRSLLLAKDDFNYVLTAPLRWEKQDWLDVGTSVVLIAGSSFNDGSTRKEAQEERHIGDNQTKRFQEFGAMYSWFVLGLFEAYGTATGSARPKAVAFDGFVAAGIASGVVAPVIKYSVGRERPNKTESTFKFRPFSGNYSFPSGHTTQAFAVASVISAHYNQWWIKGAAYGIAGCVGYSRIQQNAHFASDVVAGALIGYSVGRTVVRHNNQSAEKTSVLWSPCFFEKAAGIQFRKNY